MKLATRWCLIALVFGVTALATAAVPASDDPGIRLRLVDGSASTAQVEVKWTKSAADAQLAIRGAWASVVDSTKPMAKELVEMNGEVASFNATWQGVEAGDWARIDIDLAGSASGQPVWLISERGAGVLRWQLVTTLEQTPTGVELIQPRAYRITQYGASDDARSVIGDANGAVNNADSGGFLVEPMVQATAPVSIFMEDAQVKSIPDGPRDCGDTSPSWSANGLFHISSAPAGATSDAITVHVTITHPQMADLQVGIFYDPNYPGGSGKYLWKNDPGTNLDSDFTHDRYGHSLPGLNESVNGYYNVAARDCFAGSTGTFNYWSLRVEYDATPTIDLVADSATVSASSVAAGGSVNLSWAGHVAGTGSVGSNFNTTFYLSTDAAWSAGDVSLGQMTVSGANSPGDTFGDASPGRSLTIPGGTANGNYFVLARVDSGGAVAEVNENNNVVAAALTVAPSQAIDLVADSLSVSPNNAMPGGTISLTYTGRVQGTGTVGGSFTIGFYLSTDAVIDASDPVLSRRTSTWGNNPGDVFGEAGFAVTVPGTTAAGSYFVLYMVDDANVISETNENNNLAMFMPFTVGSTGTPNLVAQTCSAAPTTVQVNGNTVLSWYGRNNGTLASGSFNRVVYLSTDQQYSSGSDRTLSSQTVAGGWPAGSANTQYTDNVTIPGDVVAGTYYLGVMLDSGNAVAESNENDNWCSTALTVTGGGGGGGGGGGATTRWLLPAAASAPGYGASDWRSQLAVANPTSATRQASIYYVADGQSWPGTLLAGPYAIGPAKSVYLEDPLLNLNPTAGLVYVDLDAAGPVVTSRTYNLAADGSTFGQGIPALALTGATAPQELILPMVHSVPGAFHTNLGLIQTSAGSFQVEVSLYTSAGSLLASKSYTRTAAYDQVNDVFDDMGLGSLAINGAWIRVRLVGGNPAYWTCYASVVDDRTGDPTYVAPVEHVTTR